LDAEGRVLLRKEGASESNRINDCSRLAMKTDVRENNHWKKAQKPSIELSFMTIRMLPPAVAVSQGRFSYRANFFIPILAASLW
jgi:hypothetical protein